MIQIGNKISNIRKKVKKSQNMQARSLLIKSSTNAHNISCSVFGIQSVRWRKPRWLPMAQSKVFKVPERKKVPEAEAEELMRLDKNYK